MKKQIKYFLTLCAGLIAVICIAACGESHTPSSSKELEQLKMPTHLKADFWELTWEDVDNANGYTVRIFEDEYQTDETEFSLFAYLSPDKRYTLDVKANGDGENYSDSEWESIVYQTEKVTENLSVHLLTEKNYSPLDGLAGTYEVSIAPNKIPTDGRVVLPDYINGRPVTSYSYPHVLNAVLYEYPNLKKIRLPNTLKQISGGFRNSSVREVHIPNGVEYVGGFIDCKKLTKVYLPDTVTEINSFSGCSALTEIDIPDSVKIIGSFKNTGLTEIDLPNGVIEIYPRAFENVRLTELDLPETLTKIGDNAFQNTKLTTLEIPKSVTSIGADILLDTPWYEEQADGFLYLGDVVYGYKGEIPEKSVWTTADFKDGLRLFANGIFQNRTEIESFSFPDCVELIGANLFAGCTGLREVTLPINLRVIGIQAFSSCTSLAEIEFPDKLTTISANAFAKSGLVNVSVPTNVKEIGASAFSHCKALTMVSLAEGIETISAGAFAYCDNLENANIPSSVKEMGSQLFYFCKKLSSVITFPKTCEKIPENAFYGCENLTEIIIPDSVTTIGMRAFANTGLTSVTLPKNLTKINDLSFFDCKALTSMVVSSEITSLGLTAFYWADNLKTVYYTGTEEEWSEVEWTREDITSLYDFMELGYKVSKAEINAWLDEFKENLTVYYYSEVEPVGAGNFWHYDKDGKPVEW